MVHVWLLCGYFRLMRFGIGPLAVAPYAEIAQLWTEAEALSFDSAWVGDHVKWAGPPWVDTGAQRE
jgi:alkanesulfonate monooxygenase SsuD/methylene tetrahydromethanopterin reductase-like flavin-dependent oxidoreductase (luciferase family)